jgi:hypothetical protein
MSLGVHLPHLGRRRAPALAGSLQLDRRQCAAGDALSGTVAGAARGHPVTLIRVERRPRELRCFDVSQAPSSSSDGRFALDVPAAALPSAAGTSCALAYLVIAGVDDHGPSARLRVAASAVPHLDHRAWSGDRMLRDFDARDFHLELSEAELGGGGRISGRVHRHGASGATALLVTARCMECWRASARAALGTPQWIEDALWEHEQALTADPDAHWVRFSFELPPGLPPAVEARTLAWRYELIARAGGHRWPHETAACTPLLHEEPTWLTAQDQPS